MDTEFHFYMTGIIAKAAGFKDEEAKIIATASEYVDENDVCLKVEDRDTGKIYENYISQTMNILKPKQKLMRIYPVFHFIPGDPTDERAYRCDGKMHLLNTTPDNKLANKWMNAAFTAPQQSRLYRIGIATHAFADTWAHQNFVGWYDFYNDIAMDVKPNIGHADAEHHPDWPAHRWEDSRLVNDEVDNSERFLAAAERIYKKYTNYTKQLNRKANSSWNALRKSLTLAMGDSFSGNHIRYYDERVGRYKELAAWLGDFNERDWFNQAIDVSVRGFKDADNGLLSMFTMMQDKLYWKKGIDIKKSHWFKFQEAVKAHQAVAMKDLDTLFYKMGIDLHQV